MRKSHRIFLSIFFIFIVRAAFTINVVQKFPKPEWNRNYKINITNSKMHSLDIFIPDKVNVYQIEYPKITREWLLNFAKNKFLLSNLKYRVSSSGLSFYAENKDYCLEMDKYGIGYLCNKDYTKKAVRRKESFSIESTVLKIAAEKLIQKFGIHSKDYKYIGVKDERKSRNIYTVRFQRVLNDIECQFERFDVSFGNGMRLATIFFAWRKIKLIEKFSTISSTVAFNELKINPDSMYASSPCVPGDVQSYRLVYDFLPVEQDFIIPLYKFSFVAPKKYPFMRIFGFTPAIGNENF